LPFIEIEFRDIIFDSNVRSYCVNSTFQCPNYAHSWGCPPEAPYLEKLVSQFHRFFNPKKSEVSIRNTLYMKNLLRDELEKEILRFIADYPEKYEDQLILWDGFCRLCHNKKDLGCTYDSGMPCRYPNKIRYSMEAVGIDVTKSVRNLNFNIEWPPIRYLYRFGLICFK
jgi:predicted metal-binding protein